MLVIVPWLFTPSVRNRLLRLFWPLIEGKLNVPTEVLPKPPRFCATLTGDAPGVSISSWVKLRPLSGRSTTCCSVIAVPSSDEDA